MSGHKRDADAMSIVFDAAFLEPWNRGEEVGVKLMPGSQMNMQKAKDFLELIAKFEYEDRTSTYYYTFDLAAIQLLVEKGVQIDDKKSESVSNQQFDKRTWSLFTIMKQLQGFAGPTGQVIGPDEGGFEWAKTIWGGADGAGGAGGTGGIGGAARSRESDETFPELYSLADGEKDDLEIYKNDTFVARWYQKATLQRIRVTPRHVRSGIAILPCGSGKTAVGVMVAVSVKQSTIVLCASAQSVNDWEKQFIFVSDIQPGKLLKWQAGSTPNFEEAASIVLITTYDMLARGGTAEFRDKINRHHWGLALLDEVNLAANDTGRNAYSINAKCKIGLTATFVRNNDARGTQIQSLLKTIGPVLVEVPKSVLDCKQKSNLKVFSIPTFVDQEWTAAFLSLESEQAYQDSPWFKSARDAVQAKRADLTQNEVNDLVMARYKARRDTKRSLIYDMNPEKFTVVEYYLRYYQLLGLHTLVFFESITLIQEYAKLLGGNTVFITGDTNDAERAKLYSAWENATHGSKLTLLVTEVADAALNFPFCDAVVEVQRKGSSQNQAVQRAGRADRPKSLDSGLGYNVKHFVQIYTVLLDANGKEYGTIRGLDRENMAVRNAYLERMGYAIQSDTVPLQEFSRSAYRFRSGKIFDEDSKRKFELFEEARPRVLNPKGNMYFGSALLTNIMRVEEEAAPFLPWLSRA
jgi:superfamily II DNA or RNA helicase